MKCRHVHDFIKGTTIALPAPVQSPGHGEFDILRANPKAARVVSAHVAALKALRHPRIRSAAGR